MKQSNRIILVALTLSLAALPAFGAAKKKGAAAASPTPSGTPDTGLSADQKKALEAAKKSGPADASAFAGDVDESPAWFAKNDQVIAQLKELIKSLPDGEAKATRMIQLAEYHWQKASRLHLRAVKKFNKIYDDWFMKNGAEKGIPEPKLDDTESDKVMNQAVTIYEYVIKKYPNTSKGDQAHYYLGQSYLQLAKKDQAVATFKKLVERYPESEFIPDAYLGLGEFFFENKKLDDALEWYGKATGPKYKNTKNWGYAEYKLGWVWENKGDYAKAVEIFKGVVQYSIDAEARGLKLEYKEQALKDLVVAYANVGKVDEAEAYFRSISGGQDYFRKFLELFGAQLFAQGRDDESIMVYKKLVALDPMNSNTLTYEGEILKAYMRKADRLAVLGQLKVIVAMVKPESAWVQKNAAEAEKISAERESLEGSVSKYAREVFDEGKKLSGEQQFNDYQQAEQFCDYYIQTFPTAKNAYPLRMMQAEVEYKLAGASHDAHFQVDKYRQAEENYIKVTEQDAPKGTGASGDNFRPLAAEDAIFAAEKVIDIEKNAGRKDPKPAAGDFNPRELPAEEQALIKACDTYVKYVPKGPKIIPTRYKAAYLLYEFNQYDDAMKRFQGVIQAAPGSEQARFAADLTLNVFEVRKDAKSANDTVRGYLKIPALVAQKYTEDGVPKDYHKTLQDVLEKSSLKLTEQLEAQSKFYDAANAYLQFTKDFPGSPLAETALFNASVAYEKGEHVDEAIKVREEFITKYPNSDHTPDVILFLGDNYRKTTDFAHAATYYEALADKHPKYKASCDALYNAAFFRENLGETPKAILDYRGYLKQCADRPDAHEVLFTIGDIYEKKKNNVDAVKTYEEYLKTFGNKKSPDLFLDIKQREATMLYESGKKKEAYLKYAEVTSAYKSLIAQKAKIGPTGLGAAAKAAFYAIEPKFEE